MFILLLAIALAPMRAAASDWVIIVHPAREIALEKSEIAQIFLKQRRFWRDGSLIIPVNREAGSVSRKSFARTFLGRGSRNRVNYWNRQYFQGVFPPVTLASDEAVLRYVASEPRAIGYIPAALVTEAVRSAGKFSTSN